MITWLKSLPRRKFIFLYIIIVTVLSLLLVGVGSWLIIPKVSADTKHVEKTDTNEGFISESTFTGEKQEPTPKEAVFGSGYTRNDDGETGYTLTWTGCKLVGSEEKITTSAYAGLVAGTHYYEIKDNATGQIISRNHAFEIAQDTFTVESITTPVGFEGDTVTIEITVKGTKATGLSSVIFEEKRSIAAGEHGTSTAIGVTKNSSYNITKAILDSKFGALNSDSNSDKYNLDNYNSNNFKTSTVNTSYVVLPRAKAIVGTATTYYADICKALDGNVNNTATVIPMQSFTYSTTTYTSGTNYTHVIDEACTIGANVTLLIRHDTGEAMTYGTDDFASNPFPNQITGKSASAYGVKSKQKNVVTVSDNVTITANGVIYISGEVTGSQNELNGASLTTGNHSQITLGKNAKINATNDIYCYGFIAEATLDNGSQVNMTSGNLTAVYTVIEHRGGSIFGGMTGSSYSEIKAVSLQTAAFNRFFLRSLTSTVSVSQSATIKGYADLHANDQHNSTIIKLVGYDNNNLVNLSSGSKLTAKFRTDTSKNEIHIYGGATINSMSLMVKLAGGTTGTLVSLLGMNEITLSTANILFPISHYWDIRLHKSESGSAATVTSPSQGIKILPGGSITVDEGVTFNVGTLAVYPEEVSTSTEYTNLNVHVTTAPTASVYPYNVKTAGVLNVAGTLNVTNLGGTVNATSANAKVKISGSNSVSSKELATTTPDGGFASILDGCSYRTISLNANGPVAISSSSASNKGLSSGVTYTSGAISNSYAWVYDKTITVKYDNDCDGTADTTKTQTAKSNVDLILTGDFYPTLSKDYYEFGGWYSDAACSNAVSEGTAISSDITLYAKWTPIKYTIKHQYVYDSTFESNPSLTVPSDITDFTVEDTRLASILEKETHDPYSFVGWYLGADTGSSKALAATITPATFLKDCNASTTASSTITVYGHWTNISYNVQFVDDKYNGWTAETIKLSTAQLGSARFNEIIGELENYKESTHHTKRYYISGWKYGETSVTDFSFIDLNDTETVYKIYPVWAEKVAVNIDYGLTAKTGPKISLTNSETTAEGSGIWITPGYTYTLDSTSVKSGDDNINIAYYFNAWSASTGGTVSDYVLTIIESATAGSTVTATASWNDKHKIVSKINSGTYGSVSISVTITPNTTGSNPSYSSSGAGGTVYAKPTDTVTIKATATGTKTGSVLNRTYYGTEIVIAGAVSQTSSYTAKYYGDDKYDNENKIEKPLDLENTTATETTITISSVTL